MKRLYLATTHSLGLAVLSLGLLVMQSYSAHGQNGPPPPPPDSQSQNPSLDVPEAQVPATVAQPALATQALHLQAALQRGPEKNKTAFGTNNEKVWSALQAECGTVNDNCANAAVFAAVAECEASAKYFRKGTKGWQILNIVLTLTSAGFTAAGASTTLTQAKVFSTFGGSTGLAASYPAINANASGDQAGMTTVATTLGKLQMFLLGTGSPATPPSATSIYQQARVYGGTCATAANASPATTPSGGSSH